MIMSDITRFFAETMDTNAEFKALALSLTGVEDFKFYLNIDTINTELEHDNCCAIITYEDSDEREVEKSFKSTLLFSILRHENTESGNIIEEPTSRNLELIIQKGLEIIAKEMRIYGIAGETNVLFDYINIESLNPEGEDDLQMQVDIKIKQEKYINQSQI